MPGPGDLYAVAEEWLTACEEAVATTVGGPIECAFVSPGEPAVTCPMLAVYVGSALAASTSPVGPELAPGKRPDITGGVFLATLVALVTRCSPTDEEPSIADLQATAERVDADLWAIWNHTWSRKHAGTLFSAPRGRREMFFDPWLRLPTEGGCAGWQLTLRVQLDGYIPA